MTDDDPDVLEMFGPPTPRAVVKPTPSDHLADYRHRPRFRYRADGRAYPLLTQPEPVETELPDDHCPSPDDDGPPGTRKTDDGV